MNPEVETLLNELREKKRKEDEQKAIHEKYAQELRIKQEEARIIQENERKEKISNFIQSNKPKWEAEERFCAENGTPITYSDVRCPICNEVILQRRKLTPREIEINKRLNPDFKNQPPYECCIEIMEKRETIYKLRLNDEGYYSYEWDPTDPDGIRAEAERRKKHNEDIYKQIETLRSKLLPE